MAKYTENLYNIIDNASRNKPMLSRDEKIELGRKMIFDFDYPIFDNDYKKILETHFLKNFYMNEIGQETYGQFKMQLEVWLLINMPFYNKMFESELIEFNPLENSKMVTTYTKKNDLNQDNTGNQKSNTNSDTAENTKMVTSYTKKNDLNQNNTGNQKSNTNSDTAENTTANEKLKRDSDEFKRELTTDTPQNRLTITSENGSGVIEYAKNISEDKANTLYNQDKDNTRSSNVTDETITNADTVSNTTANSLEEYEQNRQGNLGVTNETTANADTVSNTTANSLEEYVQNRQGKLGVTNYADMIVKYRNSFIRVEQLMFNEMRELFMLIY